MQNKNKLSFGRAGFLMQVNEIYEYFFKYILAWYIQIK